MTYYLRQVVLECSLEEEATSRFRTWEESLARQGVSVILGSGEPEKHGQDEERRFEATLWIADETEKILRHLTRNEPVLGYCHALTTGRDLSGVRYLCMKLTELDVDYLDKVYRRYRGIPWDILETERCYLRQTTEADVDAFYEIYAEPSVTAYMEALYPDREQELSYTRDYIRNVYEFYGHGVWTVCNREDDQVIGRAGLSYREGYDEPELGFLVGVPWQGKGIATEICEAILRFGEEELDFQEVIAFAEPENEVSAHLLTKLGFRPERDVTLLGRIHVLWRRKCRDQNTF